MEAINLWDNVPLYIEGEEIPVLKYYPAKEKRGTGTVIIFAGGAYMRRSVHEGEGYALFLNEAGLDAFVLEYRVSPYRHPAPLMDARRAVRYVRANAERFGINPDRIAVMGSSAGGHLAAHVSVFRGEIDDEPRDSFISVNPVPNGQILCYPVTDIKSHRGSYNYLLGDGIEKSETVNPIALADESAPPAFIWHTETDGAVNVSSTLLFASRLHELGVRTELHMYPDGGHGLGLAEGYPSVRRWRGDLLFWLGANGYFE